MIRRVITQVSEKNFALEDIPRESQKEDDVEISGFRIESLPHSSGERKHMSETTLRFLCIASAPLVFGERLCMAIRRYLNKRLCIDAGWNRELEEFFQVCLHLVPCHELVVKIYKEEQIISILKSTFASELSDVLKRFVVRI